MRTVSHCLLSMAHRAIHMPRKRNTCRPHAYAHWPHTPHQESHPLCVESSRLLTCVHIHIRLILPGALLPSPTPRWIARPSCNARPTPIRQNAPPFRHSYASLSSRMHHSSNSNRRLGRQVQQSYRGPAAPATFPFQHQLLLLTFGTPCPRTVETLPSEHYIPCLRIVPPSIDPSVGPRQRLLARATTLTRHW